MEDAELATPRANQPAVEQAEPPPAHAQRGAARSRAWQNRNKHCTHTRELSIQTHVTVLAPQKCQVNMGFNTWGRAQKRNHRCAKTPKAPDQQAAAIKNQAALEQADGGLRVDAPHDRERVLVAMVFYSVCANEGVSKVESCTTSTSTRTHEKELHCLTTCFVHFR